mmetsp:Transcript_102421/g.184742  ORF Transcript_102421/g.184742 Transcript_102421/m.184742 type:complete len:323 (-) Transcript_102421:68-1036(-)
MQWNSHLAGHDIQREDDLLQDEKWYHHCAAHKESSCLGQLVSKHHEAPAMAQVHEGKEDAQAGVHVIWPPLVLDLTVDFEVLRRGALGSQRHHGLESLTLIDGLLLQKPSRDVVPVASAAKCIGVHVLVVAAGALALAVVAEERDAENLPQWLLLVGRQEFTCAVEHPLGWHWQPDKPREHVDCCGIRAKRGVHSHPHGEAQPDVAASNVDHGKTHQPGWRCRRVESKTARAKDGCEDCGGHPCNAVVQIHATCSQGCEHCDVLAILSRLRHRVGVTCGESAEVKLLVHHVIAAIVAEQAHASTGSAGRTSGCIACCAQLHG